MKGLALAPLAHDIEPMQKFEGISFLWALGMVALLALIYGVRAFIGYRKVAQDAQTDYDYRSGENMLPKHITHDGFIKAYKRHNNPRGSAYMAAGLSAILILTAPALMIIQFLLHQLWLLNDKSRVFEPGFLVWQFFIFFAIIAVWAGIAYITALKYHAGSSISLEDELAKKTGKS